MPSFRSFTVRSLALALSLSLAACSSSTPTTPIATQATPEAAPAIDPNAAAPAQPTTAPAPVTEAARTLQGVASLGGAPLAGATVQVFDAYSNAPLTAESQGVRLAGPFGTTDEQGHFQVALVGLAPGSALKLVAQKGLQRVEALFLEEEAPAALHVLAADELACDEVSTTESLLLDGLLQTSRALKPQAALRTLGSTFQQFRSLREKVRGELIRTPQMYAPLTNGATTPEALQLRQSMVRVLLGNAGVQNVVGQTLLEGVRGLSEAAQQEGNRAQGEEASTDSHAFLGTDVTVSLDPATGKLTVKNARTGATLENLDDKQSIDKVLRKPSRSSGRRVQNFPSTPAVVAGIQDIEDIDDESQMILTQAQLDNMANVPYHTNAMPLGLDFHIVPAQTAEGYKLTFYGGKLDAIGPAQDRILYFKAVGNGTYRLNSYDGNPNETYNSIVAGTRIGVHLDPEVGAQYPAPAPLANAPQSFHFQENDNYVYDIFVDGNGFAGFALYDPAGAPRWYALRGEASPIVPPGP